MSSRRDEDVACACGASFNREAWLSLVVVACIEPVDVSRSVINWPQNVCIEVRRCRRCARSIPISVTTGISRGVDGESTAGERWSAVRARLHVASMTAPLEFESKRRRAAGTS